MLVPTIIIDMSWAAFFLVWFVGALRAKREISGDTWFSRRRFTIPRLGLAAVLIVAVARCPAHFDPPVELPMLFRPTETLTWIAAALSLLGIGFAIWARVYLGGNWSARPAVKEGHELVTSGPYRFVRHPIYTGMLVAAGGLTLTGSTAGGFGMVFATFVLLRRVVREEQIMLKLFPERYRAYCRQTKRLIPLVW